MLNLRNGLVLVGCVIGGFIASGGRGLVARAAEPPRWFVRAVAPAEGPIASEGSEASRRIAQLEQRLKELESERHRVTAKAPANREGSSELEAVLAQNRELVERNRALAAENQALAEGHLFEAPAAARACEPSSAADPRTHIRFWAQQLRDSDTGSRRRLTPDQSAAIQVLLRPERELDSHNPWNELGSSALASAR